jgi:integrase
VEQVADLKKGDSIEIREKKTGKLKRVTFNQNAVDAIGNLLRSREYDEVEDLFIGQRGTVLSVPSLNQKIKRWLKRLNVKGNFGTHTLRKTWAYHQYKFNHLPLPTLMKALNHSSQAVSLRYLGIQERELQDAYMYEI